MSFTNFVTRFLHSFHRWLEQAVDHVSYPVLKHKPIGLHLLSFFVTEMLFHNFESILEISDGFLNSQKVELCCTYKGRLSEKSFGELSLLIVWTSYRI